MAEDSTYLKIGEVARTTGLTHRALRYYEEMHLLQPASRMEGGLRLYSPEDVKRLELIKRLKELFGFPLADIRQLVESEEDIRRLRREVRAQPGPLTRRRQLKKVIRLLEGQIELIDQKMNQLQEIRTQWEERLAKNRAALSELDLELLHAVEPAMPEPVPGRI